MLDVPTPDGARRRPSFNIQGATVMLCLSSSILPKMRLCIRGSIWVARVPFVEVGLVLNGKLRWLQSLPYLPAFERTASTR